MTTPCSLTGVKEALRCAEKDIHLVFDCICTPLDDDPRCSLLRIRLTLAAKWDALQDAVRSINASKLSNVKQYVREMRDEARRKCEEANP